MASDSEYMAIQSSGRKFLFLQPPMRHARICSASIFEKFTLDVLKNYTTYERYFYINKKIEEDKILPKSKTKSLLIKKVDPAVYFGDE